MLFSELFLWTIRTPVCPQYLLGAAHLAALGEVPDSPEEGAGHQSSLETYPEPALAQAATQAGPDLFLHTLPSWDKGAPSTAFVSSL